MLGVGQSPVEPRLQPNQQLDADTIHRIFGSKIVWLLPTKDLTVSNTYNIIE